MEFKTTSVEELHKFIADKERELSALRFSAQGSKNRNVKLASTLGKEVARAMTELTSKHKNSQG